MINLYKYTGYGIQTIWDESVEHEKDVLYPGEIFILLRPAGLYLSMIITPRGCRGIFCTTVDGCSFTPRVA